MTLVSQERLKEVFSYDIDTGLFTWLIRTGGHSKVGKIAGTLHATGYIHIAIDGRSYQAHRLAYLYMMGEWPKNDVDHMDGIRDNNRWNNLRDATRSENNQNQKIARSDNKTGIAGVNWHKGKKSFSSSITVSGKRKYLGHFSTAELAQEAYLKAKSDLHPFMINIPSE